MAREVPTFKDYYEVLHLHPEADAAMVDQAYWHLARVYNAAIPTDSAARPMLEELNEAYSVLRTPELRDEYDRLRDAVLGVGALPEAPPAVMEPLPLSVMERQKPKPKASDDQELPPADGAKKERRRSLRRPQIELTMTSVAVPNWQSIIVLISLLLLAGAAITAGAEPALVLLALLVGVGFTVIPMKTRAPRFPSLPRPQIVLPAVGPPNLVNRLPHQNFDPDELRNSTEAMLARWRETHSERTPARGSATPSMDGAASDDPNARERHATEQEDAPVVDTERLRQSLRQSTEAIRARIRDADTEGD